MPDLSDADFVYALDAGKAVPCLAEFLCSIPKDCKKVEGGASQDEEMPDEMEKRFVLCHIKRDP